MSPRDRECGCQDWGAWRLMRLTGGPMCDGGKKVGSEKSIKGRTRRDDERVQDVVRVVYQKRTEEKRYDHPKKSAKNSAMDPSRALYQTKARPGPHAAGPWRQAVSAVREAGDWQAHAPRRGRRPRHGARLRFTRLSDNTVAVYVELHAAHSVGVSSMLVKRLINFYTSSSQVLSIAHQNFAMRLLASVTPIKIPINLPVPTIRYNRSDPPAWLPLLSPISCRRLVSQ
ncbi:hypothetical protein K470DRAFT_264536 [Piedraia hortae CBS 480.64]|uniref:Uncharacterized protein n=1 Tax=Piedraia hortae CBS 480.64 TaxID=1314780 RepID=A0A6A7BYY6_9PEZI|nr:hypothetical protein K470DRAFT_264536 [Piedraia hortae CBS 480.64]